MEIIYHTTRRGSCTELKLVTDNLPKNTWVYLGLAKRVYFFDWLQELGFPELELNNLSHVFM